MSSNYDYDVIVLGGGSAGTAAAAAAAAKGARVAMVNDGELGGLCILRGCMPTKSMLQSTHLLGEIAHAGDLGVQVGSVGHDFRFIMERKARLVARFKQAKVKSIESASYQVIDGRGSFVDEERVRVGGKLLRARAYVIATGSVSVAPGAEGAGDIEYLTSDDVMKLESRPESLVVQGAGAIGLELGQFFARLGVPVLQINRSEVCSKVDDDLAVEMRKILDDEPNLEFLAPAHLRSVSPSTGGILFEIDGPDGRRRHEAAAFLVAIGRRPAVEGLGLETAGIEHDAWCVRHDERMRTSNPKVYVAGDATGNYQVLHLANQEGRVAGCNAAGGTDIRVMDYRLQMNVVFTDPPLALLGETEREAVAAGKDVVSAIKRIPSQGRGITMETRHGLIKVIADGKTGEILGAQIVGPRADDLIHILAAIMHFRGGVADLNEIPWYHPTLSESLIEIARKLASRVEGMEPAPAPPA